MIRFYFLSVGFFLGTAGLFNVWLDNMSSWAWLAGTIAWIVVTGGLLYEHGMRAERRTRPNQTVS